MLLGTDAECAGKVMQGKIASMSAPLIKSMNNAIFRHRLCGHGNIVQVLLERGVDINTESKEHGNALYAA